MSASNRTLPVLLTSSIILCRKWPDNQFFLWSQFAKEGRVKRLDQAFRPQTLHMGGFPFSLVSLFHFQNCPTQGFPVKVHLQFAFLQNLEWTKGRVLTGKQVGSIGLSLRCPSSWIPETCGTSGPLRSSGRLSLAADLLTK